MSLSVEAIDEIKGNALAAIADAVSLDSLKEVKLAHVGDKSPIAKSNQQLASLSIDEPASSSVRQPACLPVAAPSGAAGAPDRTRRKRPSAGDEVRARSVRS